MTERDHKVEENLFKEERKGKVKVADHLGMEESGVTDGSLMRALRRSENVEQMVNRYAEGSAEG